MNWISESVWLAVGGLSLVWSEDALTRLARPTVWVPLRKLLQQPGRWPAPLPSRAGTSLVVMGLQDGLDARPSGVAKAWMRDEVGPVIRAFRQRGASGAALVFWHPDGDRRVELNRLGAGGAEWRCEGDHRPRLPLSALLTSGAAARTSRIVAFRGGGA